MIAIYYVRETGPYHLYIIDVPDATEKDFVNAINEEQYPFPDSEVVFLENNMVVKTIILE